jgi:hypothetical protein
MAQTIIDEGLKGSMEEVWGTEITLYYPGLYAGACDLAGIYNGKASILDFKQSNTRKKKRVDYRLLLTTCSICYGSQ